MENLEICYLDYYIPPTALSALDFTRQLDKARLPAAFRNEEEYFQFITTVLLQKEIRVETELKEAEMLGGLIEKMFAVHPINPADIDLILVIQEMKANPRENLGHLLQYCYNLHNAFVLNLSGNHCANLNVACCLASALGSLGQYNNVLIVNAVKAAGVNERILGTYGVLGDAAGLMLLQRKPGLCTIEDNYILSKGMFHAADLNKNQSLLQYKYTLQSLRTLMERNQLEPGHVAKVIIQNANPFLITNVLSELGVSTDKIFLDNVGRFGHVDSLDFLVNLKEVAAGTTRSGGSRVLAFDMGWAGTFASSLIRLS